MSYGPLPTRLILLSDLPSVAQGEKVRFLGCVSHYNARTGILTLHHAYPAPSTNSHVTAAVDVNLLLENLKSTDTQVGEWLNVMGYVQRVDGSGAVRKSSRPDGGKGPNEGHAVKVQAVMLWSAGAVKVWEYEKAVEMRKVIQVSQI